MLNKLVLDKEAYLISEKMLRSISDELNAEEVELVLCLPGHIHERVALFKWRRTVGRLEETPDASLPHEDSDVNKVLQAGEAYISPIRVANSLRQGVGVESKTTEEVSLAVPILHRKAIIGCLRLVTNQKLAQRDNIINRIRDLASLISLPAQAYRELSTTTQLSYRFAAWRAEQMQIQPEAAIQQIADLLYDIISPLAVIISVNVGFQCFEKRAGIGVETQCRREVRDDKDADTLLHLDTFSASTQQENLITKLEVTRREGRIPSLELGRLTLVVKPEDENLVQHTLGTHQLHRQTIGAVLNEMLLGITRDYLQSVLENFALRLNSNHDMNYFSWFAEVNKAACEAGLKWVVAVNPETGDLIGEAEPVAFIHDYRNQFGQMARAKILHGAFSPSVAKARGVLTVLLPVSETSIWLGEEREGFGREIDSPTPWYVFLDRFVEIADSALARIFAVTEMQRLQMEAAQTQALAAMAVTTSTLTHQLANLVRNIAMPINTLNEALILGKLHAEAEIEEMISSMQYSVEELVELLSQTMLQGKLDDHRPCSLRKAIQVATQLFKDSLKRTRVELQIRVEDGLIVDMPFHVVSLAISNFVSNALDAMKLTGGKIYIEADDIGEMIRCVITDNGPGITPNLQSRLFKLGVTTKSKSGGWGLYLVQRSLVENRGHVELTSSQPGETRFTICFPKIRPQ